MAAAKGNRNLKFVLRVASSLIYSARQSTKLTDGIVEGNWESLVSRDDFDEVQHLLSGKPRARSEGEDPYWLKPVLLCGKCGGKFTASVVKQGRYRYYECFTCRGERIGVEKAHDQIIAVLDQISLSKEVVDSIKDSLSAEIGSEKVQIEGRRNELTRGIAKVHGQLEPLVDELCSEEPNCR
jgi:hypothetical protein